MYFHDIHVRLTISHLDQASHMICLVHKELKLSRSISTYLLETIAETGVVNFAAWRRGTHPASFIYQEGSRCNVDRQKMVDFTLDRLHDALASGWYFG